MEDPIYHALMDFAVRDPHLKILYFVPHAPQNLEEASPFGKFTPGLQTSSGLLSFAATLPADVREPFAKPKDILHLRLRRLLWRHVLPIDIHALQKLAASGLEPFFRVVLTNDEELAHIVDSLLFSDKVPFLHVSTIAGHGRVLVKDLNTDRLLEFVDSVFVHLSKIPELHGYITAVRDAMQPADLQHSKPLTIGRSFHNVVTPNELALVSYGWAFSKEDPLVQEGRSSAIGNPEVYIDRICLVADTVQAERQNLMTKLPASLLDNVYLISAPGIHWSHYRDWRGRGDGLPAEYREAFKVAYKNAVQQSTYFDQINSVNMRSLVENKMFQTILASRAADLHSYTAGLTLLSSATLTPVLRLEPKINRVRGEMKVIAHCARSNARVRAQFKQSRLTRVAGQHMRDLVDNKFLERIDHYGAVPQIQGLKIVSDVPLEWLPCAGLALGLRYDLSRIPVLPGNLFLHHCIVPPMVINMSSLLDILVIRSFNSNDPLKSLLERSIDAVLEGTESKGQKIRFVDVESDDELVNALNKFTGTILIFDGHGSYEEKFGIGTFVIGGRPVDVWSLKNRCRFPPIVIFSACDTHPLDGSHSSCANAAFTLGAMTVLATSLPINGGLAAMFIARLIFRIFEFVPIALKVREILTWREVVSGMLRMSYTTELTRLLVRYGKLSISDTARDRIQLVANKAINARQGDWYEQYLKALASESRMDINNIRKMVVQWASITDSHKYIQLGSPENVVITAYST